MTIRSCPERTPTAIRISSINTQIICRKCMTFCERMRQLVDSTRTSCAHQRSRRAECRNSAKCTASISMRSSFRWIFRLPMSTSCRRPHSETAGRDRSESRRTARISSRNHDQVRQWDRYGDGVHNDQIAKLTATLLLTARGTPRCTTARKWACAPRLRRARKM